MRIIRTVEEMQSACRALRQAGKPLGLVPTMGALHEGHLSLVRASKAACAATAATIFVNPTQFGANEDLGKYPRTFEADCRLLEAEDVDLLFTPGVEEMYPAGASTWVEVEGVGNRLEGASRPGHLRGVATIVAKLFHIAAPTHAFFWPERCGPAGGAAQDGPRSQLRPANRRLPDCARAPMGWR